MDLEKEIEQLKAYIAELEAKIKELEARIADLEAQVRAHLATIASLEANIKELEATIEKLNAEIQQLRGVIAEQAEKIRQQEATITQQVGEIANLNSNVAALTNTVGGLTAENSTLKNTISDQERTISEQADDINAKLATIEHNNSTIAKLDGKLTNLQNEHTELKDKYANFQRELNDMQNTIDMGNSQNRELEHQIRVHLNTISAKDAIISTLRDEKSALTERIDGVEAIEDQARRDIMAARDKVADIETENLRLNNSIANLVASTSLREKEIKDLKEQVYSANVAKDAGIKAVRDDYENKLSDQKDSYEAKIAQLEAQIAAACTFTDDQKYTIRLNNEKKAIQKNYDAKLAEATKKAKKFVKKARVLVDDKPQALLNLPEANDYK